MTAVASELRRRMTGAARKADYEGSRASAIKLHCLECVCGSQREVADCASYACFLWPFRPYGDTERPGGVVPTLEEYRAEQARIRENSKPIGRKAEA